MELFKLFGSVFIDNSKANESLDQTEKKGKGVAGTLGDMVGTAAKWGAGVFAAGSVAVGGMLALANQTSKAADEIDKLSERTGIQREELQRWKYAAGQSGADIGKLETGIKTLSTSMVGATNGNKAATAAFEQLGISVADLKNKSQSEIFDQVIKGLAGMEQGAARNALGNQVLGKSYTELLPLLNQGTAGIDALKSRADQLGIVMSEDAVKANVQFGDTLSDVKQALGGMVAQLGTAVLPVLMTFLNIILDNMPAIQAVFKVVFGIISGLLNGFVGVINFVVDRVKAWVDDNQAKLLIWQITLSKVFEAVQGVLQLFVTAIGILFQNDIGGFLEGLYFAFERIFGEEIAGVLTDYVESAIAMFKEFFGFVAVAAETFWNLMTYIWTNYGEGIKTFITVILTTVYSTFKATFDIISNLFKIFSGVFQGDWAKVWEGVKGVFKGVWDGIVAIAKGAVNLVINAMNGMIKGLNKISFDIPKWVPVIGGKSWGFNLSQIPLLAAGGDVRRGGAAIVGEAGPELLELPTGARVTPLSNLGPRVVFAEGAFAGAIILDDYGVDRLMDRVVGRLQSLGVK